MFNQKVDNDLLAPGCRFQINVAQDVILSSFGISVVSRCQVSGVRFQQPHFLSFVVGSDRMCHFLIKPADRSASSYSDT